KDIFDRIAFGHGEPPPVASSGRPVVSLNAKPASPGNLDDFELLGTSNGYMNSSEFLSFVHDAENGVKQTGMFEGHGPLAILLIVFLGGLALNLTPCVLPMIPINLAIIGAGAQSGSHSRGFLLGAAYGAAMAIVYGV